MLVPHTSKCVWPETRSPTQLTNSRPLNLETHLMYTSEDPEDFAQL
ncbi:hypothetical protein AVEN_105921-1, partial [Araneus ventricosus]